MRIGKNKEPNLDKFIKDMENKMETIGFCFQTLNFLFPEKSEIEIYQKLIELLTAGISDKELNTLSLALNKMGNQKVKEVTDIYRNFSDTDNN